MKLKEPISIFLGGISLEDKASDVGAYMYLSIAVLSALYVQYIVYLCTLMYTTVM